MKNSNLIFFIVSLIFVLFNVVHSQVVFDLNIEGTFTGCWSPTGSTLSTGTFLTLFQSSAAGAPPPVDSSLYIKLPTDASPNVVSQNPNSLAIQMGGIGPLTRNQFCSGLNAQPLPGTLSIPQIGKPTYKGLSGSRIKVAGTQVNLAACNPPGVAGVACNPASAAYTLTAIDVIPAENVITGYLTAGPNTNTQSSFSIANVACKPIVYNFPVKNRALVSINGKVVDFYGFTVDPAALPIGLPNCVAEGWFSQIAGENAFYYHKVTVPTGTRLPNQFVVASAQCTDAGDLIAWGAVSLGTAGSWPVGKTLGTVAIDNVRTGTAIAKVVPTDAGAVATFPTGFWTVTQAITGRCPRTLRITWNHPGITLPAKATVTTDIVPKFIIVTE